MEEDLKQLLLKDLCARLLYGVKVRDVLGRTNKLTLGHDYLASLYYDGSSTWTTYKPYLRPLSAMTEEERKEYQGFIIHREHVNAWGQEWDIDCLSFDNSPRLIDWLNAHHFDYRGLIPKGIALIAPEGMYNNEE